MNRPFDAVILGAGAAGLFCAIEAGKRGRRVAVLERAERTGKKILISGGGRCNFTNIYCKHENFLSANAHFSKSALARYTPADFIALVEQHRIAYHEKTLGQLFCDGSASEITQMLEAECRAAGVQIFLSQRVQEIAPTTEFVVRTETEAFSAPVLVVATGGLSIPKMGATSFGYEVARQFGLRIQKTRPALVPLVLGGSEAGWTQLAGVSAEVTAWAGGGPKGGRGNPKFREKMLVTHRGLSGPAVLQASSYWRAGEPLMLDFAPGFATGLDGKAKLLGKLMEPKARRDETALKQALRAVLPVRMADHLADVGAPEGWTNAALEQAERRLSAWEFHPVGTEGFEKAEVTAGGINTDGLVARTMEARAVPGLFFIGEAVDVTGHLGGFNFQWAWASGVAAGRAM